MICVQNWQDLSFSKSPLQKFKKKVWVHRFFQKILPNRNIYQTSSRLNIGKDKRHYLLGTWNTISDLSLSLSLSAVSRNRYLAEGVGQ